MDRRITPYWHSLRGLYLGIIIALIVGFYAAIKLVYGRGAANLSYWTYTTSPNSTFGRLESFMKYPTDTNWLMELGEVTGGSSASFEMADDNDWAIYLSSK